MNKVGCVIVEDFKRPDRALVETFRGVAVANLDDCMNRISAVHEDIRLSLIHILNRFAPKGGVTKPTIRLMQNTTPR